MFCYLINYLCITSLWLTIVEYTNWHIYCGWTVFSLLKMSGQLQCSWLWVCLFSWQVNSSARGGVRFVGSVLQQVSGITNGRVHSPKRGCRSPPRTPPRTPPGDRELEENTYSPGKIFAALHSSSHSFVLSPSVGVSSWADSVSCHVFFPPPSLQTWGCWSSSTPGLQAVLLWTRWPVSTTRGRCPCASPGRVRLSALWRPTGWSWLPPTTAKAGRLWIPSSTGTHLKVGLMFDGKKASVCPSLFFFVWFVFIYILNLSQP